MSTSEESCFSVLVRFLLASARARVSSLGLYPDCAGDGAAAVAAEGGGAADDVEGLKAEEEDVLALLALG